MSDVVAATLNCMSPPLGLCFKWGDLTHSLRYRTRSGSDRRGIDLSKWEAKAAANSLEGSRRRSCLTQQKLWKMCFGLEVLHARARVQLANSSRIALVSRFTTSTKLLKFMRKASILFVTQL